MILSQEGTATIASRQKNRNQTATSRIKAFIIVSPEDSEIPFSTHYSILYDTLRVVSTANHERTPMDNAARRSEAGVAALWIAGHDATKAQRPCISFVRLHASFLLPYQFLLVLPLLPPP